MNRIGKLFSLFALVTLLVYTQSLSLGRVKINVANATASSTTPKYEECPANEEYEDCGTSCEPTCDDDSYEACTDDCVTACQCVSGYVRNNGTCILKSQCS
ncbi:trypsin inhibitor like cysteine rich domain-containing protein [Ditylenchus destructor]|uniref:Trypsin inhibitor like cysteine rich domain-containing protein n=1 Tax=Ditylenchus destructor TaxID=166010 RepID=A0AAD4R0T8_9BILA|nr:trypsin inhibitor like cysteine rich domain-containing protein [Ditylenchus destructor]